LHGGIIKKTGKAAAARKSSRPLPLFRLMPDGL
jgi:hypothetical protein